MRSLSRVVGVVGSLVVVGCGGQVQDDGAPDSRVHHLGGPTVERQYIVVFTDAAASEAEEGLRSLAAREHFELREVWRSALHGAVVSNVDTAAAELIAELPGVAEVTDDPVGHISATQTGAPWGLDRIDQRALPVDGSYHYNFTGAGVNAYVVDNGVDASHPEFGGRATIDFDAVGGVATSSHATHVAGILGGGTHGVAHAVRIHSVRVCRVDDCNASDVLSGVNWISANGVRPAVVNLSLQLPSVTPSLDAALTALVAKGFFVTAAAGNRLIDWQPQDACKFSPARVPTVYTVAASGTDDSETSFSAGGPCVDAFAPGAGIESSLRGGVYGSLSGTSQSAPHAAGVAALILESNPTWSAAAVTNELNARATLGVVTGIAPSGAANRLVYSLASGCAVGTTQSCCPCAGGCGCAGSSTCLPSGSWGTCTEYVCKPGVCR